MSGPTQDDDSIELSRYARWMMRASRESFFPWGELWADRSGGAEYVDWEAFAPRHDHSHQKTTAPRTSRLGEGVQHRHQQNPLENRTNDREPEDLENPPHRLPPTTRNLRGHHQRRHRATVLPGRVNKPQGLC